MKQLKKMNLDELKKLTRAEMKSIMAGSAPGPCPGRSCKTYPCCDGMHCDNDYCR